MYTSIYTKQAPDLIEQLAHTPEMRRLSEVGMHCGVDYASFSVFRDVRCFYNRWMHSIGVAGIVWHFTQDLQQAVAGLLHDIATPTFAHTIDFFNQDHINQESTESETRHRIGHSTEITGLLAQYNLTLDAVSDYHRYPIADNDVPMLSADRLEYTLGNGYIVYRMELAEIQEIYDDLFVAQNEGQTAELAFRSVSVARKFTELSLKNCHLFSSDEDRFAMQYLADLIRHALDEAVLCLQDLHTTEPAVIAKLKGNPKTCGLWNDYTNITRVQSSVAKPAHFYCVNIPAKKRYINPLVQTGSGVARILELDPVLRHKVNRYLSQSFDKWLYCEER